MGPEQERPAMSATHGSEAAASIIRCPHCDKANRVRATPKGTPRCGVCHEPLPWLVEANARTFDEELQSTVPVLVDLWAPWCGPCRAMAPALEQLARDRAGRLKMVKLNVDEAPAIASRFNVQGIPLLVLTRDGNELARLAGAAPLSRLQGWLNSQLTLAGRP
jgi:thioredoxin 2